MGERTTDPVEAMEAWKKEALDAKADAERLARTIQKMAEEVVERDEAHSEQLKACKAEVLRVTEMLAAAKKGRASDQGRLRIARTELENLRQRVGELAAENEALRMEIEQLEEPAPPVVVDPQPDTDLPVDVEEPREGAGPDFERLAGLSNQALKALAEGEVPDRFPRSTVGPIDLQVDHGGMQTVADAAISVTGYHKDGIGVFHRWKELQAEGKTRHERTNGSVEIRNCSIEVGAGKPSPLLWGSRTYNVDHYRVFGCDFISHPRIDWDGDGKSRPEIEEHAAYAGVAGGLMFCDNFAYRIGGQFLQAAGRTRPYQQYKTGDVAPRTRSGVFRVERNVAIDIGMGPRGAAAYAFYDPGTPTYPASILLEGNWWVSDWENWKGADDTWRRDDGSAARPGERDCEAAFVVNPEELADEIEDSPARGPIVELFESRRNVWVRNLSRKAIGELRGCGEIIFEDDFFRAHGGLNKVRVDHFDKASKRALLTEADARCRKVTVRNCYAQGVAGIEVHTADGQAILGPLHCPGETWEWKRGWSEFRRVG